MASLSLSGKAGIQDPAKETPNFKFCTKIANFSDFLASFINFSDHGQSQDPATYPGKFHWGVSPLNIQYTPTVYRHLQLERAYVEKSHFEIMHKNLFPFFSIFGPTQVTSTSCNSDHDNATI